MAHTQEPFGARTEQLFRGRPLTLYRLRALADWADPDRLPVSIRILLEAMLRNFDGRAIRESDVENLAKWNPSAVGAREVPFRPARVVLQDFTGVPAVVDLAAMRDAVARLGGDPKRINPLVPVDLVIDHSVQVDRFGSPDALEFNMAREFERNDERYRFLHWAQKAFTNLRIVPPATGIVHQVNLEYLASVVTTRTVDGRTEVFPDSVVGTDSHTTMINGLSVLGWGVGGIEAEAAMLGQPLYFLTPEVVGVKLVGELPPGVTATDLALTVTEMLRRHGVVGKFVEFFGPGLKHMSLADRATVANMAPEYGATVGYFPPDEETLNYLRLTGRSEEHVALVEWYLKEQGLFRTDDTPDPVFSEVLTLDLGSLEPSLAGPKRPQDRVPLRAAKEAFQKALVAPVAARGFGLDADHLARTATVRHPSGATSTLRDGSVVIAAITSCTNTSNPTVMLGAGILARKAVERGLTVPPYVKTSLAPGSRAVRRYLEDTGLQAALDQLGFAVVGFGCTTCIGNSGPLPDEVARAIVDQDLTVAAVLSGNRNFEGRIHPLVKANYLASPPLVVAYALAGRMDIDLVNEPLGHDREGRPVFLRDIWPTPEEIRAALEQAVRPEVFRREYETVFTANPRWNAIESPSGDLYQWDEGSTYIRRAPYFDGWTPGAKPVTSIVDARVLAVLGDSVTTDHISPAGSIAPKSPAGQYLIEHGVAPADFNSYGARRGNHEVMVRGTFANIRIRNLMLDGVEGGYTKHLPDGDVMPIYDAAVRYQAEGRPLLVIAGKEYGTGSSRDWAAKGPMLLGVRAVLAESFERIHRSNLVGMGILPLQFEPGETAASLGLTGDETFTIDLDDSVAPLQTVTVTATKPDGRTVRFTATARLDTVVDVDYFRHGGILQTVLTHLVGA
ncbi:MAG: aconitate hydratase AcnA [Actinomycetia bacterium]|nr:aconitate hydratase AcnA [Actinomycetes bacterium]